MRSFAVQGCQTGTQVDVGTASSAPCGLCGCAGQAGSKQPPTRSSSSCLCWHGSSRPIADSRRSVDIQGTPQFFEDGCIGRQSRQLSICTPQYPAIRRLNFLPSLSGPIALISPEDEFRRRRWLTEMTFQSNGPSVDSNSAKWCPLPTARSTRWSSVASSRDASLCLRDASCGISPRLRLGWPRADRNPSPDPFHQTSCYGALGRLRRAVPRLRKSHTQKDGVSQMEQARSVFARAGVWKFALCVITKRRQ